MWRFPWFRRQIGEAKRPFLGLIRIFVECRMRDGATWRVKPPSL
jgi:hypothetical protein